MAESENQQLGIDAEDFFEKVKRIIAETENWGAVQGKLTDLIGESGVQLGKYVLQLSDVRENGERLSVVVKSNSKGFAEASASISGATETLDKYLLVQSKLSDIPIDTTTEQGIQATNDLVQAKERLIATAIKEREIRKLSIEVDREVNFQDNFNAAQEKDRNIGILQSIALTEQFVKAEQARILTEKVAIESASEVILKQDELIRKERELLATKSLTASFVSDFIANNPGGIAVDTSEQAGVSLQNEITAARTRAAEELNRETQAIYAVKSATQQNNVAVKESIDLERASVQMKQRLAEELARVERAEQAEAVTDKLRLDFVDKAPDRALASAEELNRTSKSLAQMYGQISKGSLTAVQANEAIADAVSKTGGRLSEEQVNFQKTFLGFQDSVSSLGKEVRKDFQSMDDQAKSSTRGILLSWETMARLLTIQAIHQIVYRFISALHEGVTAAEQFQIRISEIRTISQSAQLSFDQWAGGVQKLSDQFGNPILDVAEGAYQTLSNQVAKGADTFSFMSTALQFSQVTLSTTKDSVNLLASAINSFDLSASEADHISAVFFNTIELGRLRADSLANIFGRVAPLAHSLGISFEETNAAIATLTVKGIPANEAMTLINNVLTHLLNPTKEMSNLFRSLGVVSGEAAIATFGFAGTLQKIQEFAGGSSDEIAKLEKDVRAIRGALDLTGSSLTSFRRNLAQINDVAPFDLAKKISIESAGKQFELDLNRIKNFFIEDFGQSFLAGVENISHATDLLGISEHGLVDDIKALVTGVKVAGGSFLAYATFTKIATLESRLMSLATIEEAASLNSVGFAATLAGKGVLKLVESIGKFLLTPVGALTAISTALIYSYVKTSEAESQAEQETINLSATARAEADRITASEKSNLDQQGRDLQEALDAKYQGYFQSSSAIQILLNDLSQQEQQAFKDAAQTAKTAFQALVSEMDHAISRLTADQNRAQTEVQNIQQSIEEINAGIDKSNFENRIKLLPPQEQVHVFFDDIAKQAKNTNDIINGLTLKLQQPPTPENPQVSADDAIHARKEALKAQAQAQADLNKLQEDNKKAVEDARRINEQIADLQKRLDTRQVTREETVNIQQKTAELHTLEEQVKKTSKTNNTDTIRREITAIKDEINTTHNLISTQNSDQSRLDIQERINRLNQELTIKNSIITETARLGDLAALQAKLSKDKLDSEIALKKVGDDIIARDKTQISAAQERLALAKETIANIEKVKIPDTIQTVDQENKFLQANFEIPLDKAISSGAIKSEEVVQRILAEEAAARNQIEVQIVENRKKAADVELIQRKKIIEDTLKAETDAIEKATNARVRARQEIFKILGTPKGEADAEGKPTLDRIPGVIETFSGVDIGRGLAPEVKAFLATGEGGKELQEKVDDLAQVILQNSKVLSRDRQEELVTNFNTWAGQLSKAFQDFQKANKDQTVAKQALQTSKSELQEAGLLQDKTVQSVSDAAVENTNAIRDAIIGTKAVIKSQEQLRIALLTREGIQPFGQAIIEKSEQIFKLFESKIFGEPSITLPAPTPTPIVFPTPQGDVFAPQSFQSTQNDIFAPESSTTTKTVDFSQQANSALNAQNLATQNLATQNLEIQHLTSSTKTISQNDIFAPETQNLEVHNLTHSGNSVVSQNSESFTPISENKIIEIQATPVLNPTPELIAQGAAVLARDREIIFPHHDLPKNESATLATYPIEIQTLKDSLDATSKKMGELGVEFAVERTVVHPEAVKPTFESPFDNSTPKIPIVQNLDTTTVTFTEKEAEILKSYQETKVIYEETKAKLDAASSKSVDETVTRTIEENRRSTGTTQSGDIFTPQTVELISTSTAPSTPEKQPVPVEITNKSIEATPIPLNQVTPELISTSTAPSTPESIREGQPAPVEITNKSIEVEATPVPLNQVTPELIAQGQAVLARDKFIPPDVRTAVDPLAVRELSEVIPPRPRTEVQTLKDSLDVASKKMGELGVEFAVERTIVHPEAVKPTPGSPFDTSSPKIPIVQNLDNTTVTFTEKEAEILKSYQETKQVYEETKAKLDEVSARTVDESVTRTVEDNRRSITQNLQSSNVQSSTTTESNVQSSNIRNLTAASTALSEITRDAKTFSSDVVKTDTTIKKIETPLEHPNLITSPLVPDFKPEPLGKGNVQRDRDIVKELEINRENRHESQIDTFKRQHSESTSSFDNFINRRNLDVKSVNVDTKSSIVHAENKTTAFEEFIKRRDGNLDRAQPIVQQSDLKGFPFDRPELKLPVHSRPLPVHPIQSPLLTAPVTHVPSTPLRDPKVIEAEKFLKESNTKILEERLIGTPLTVTPPQVSLSPTFNPLIPQIGAQQTHTTTDRSTNVGSISVNVTTTQPVDVKLIQSQLTQAIRRGTFKLDVT